MRAFVIAALCLTPLLAACGKGQDLNGAYETSAMVRVKLLMHKPGYTALVGNVPTIVDPVVTTIRDGAPAHDVSLPSSCDEDLVTRRIGRDIMMRQDVFRRADGTGYTVISDEEMVQAMCSDIASRDPSPKTTIR